MQWFRNVTLDYHKTDKKTFNNTDATIVFTEFCYRLTSCVWIYARIYMLSEYFDKSGS